MIPFIKIGNYLTSIKGISIYPIITLIIFVAFFALVFYFTIKMDKKTIEESSNLPLNDQEDEIQ
jgi:cbb3-type cytochrome oxidase subunit 3